MQLYTLNEWLNWIATLHGKSIDLGLDRVKYVAERLKLLTSISPIIIVGGTNGKGSTVAGLEAIYKAAGYKVGSFTSPILFKHNEQVKINGEHCPDELFCQAFAVIADALGSITLTPFEFQTLAALYILQNASLDIIILEVGLGGRLDAINIMEPDLSIITSIDLDHTQLLGDTREKIAYEKAGIFRKYKPAICGDENPPGNLLQMAKDLQADLHCLEKDFTFAKKTQCWTWSCKEKIYPDLPNNQLRTQNMAIVLMAIHLIQEKLPVKLESIREGLLNIHLPARVQMIHEDVLKILDVSHNPAAIAYLAERLEEISHHGKTYAVFSMLEDKDILGSLNAIKHKIDGWFVAPLTCARAASAEYLQKMFQQANIQQVNFLKDVQTCYAHATQKSIKGDRIVVFGSFHTVAASTLNPLAQLSTSCTRK